MKIDQFTIAGLGSLRRVTFEKVGPFVVLVGKNGSGKSWVAEALRLFFEEFSPIGGESKAGMDAFTWFQRRTEDPILVEMRLELGQAEATRIAMVADVGKGDRMSVARELRFNGGWTTKKLSVDDTTLVSEDKWNPKVAPSDVSEQEPKPIKGWTLYAFGPQASPGAISGSALVVKEGLPAAFATDSDIIDLAQEGWIATNFDSRGQDPASWAAGRGLELTPRIPDEREAPEFWRFWQTTSEPEAEHESLEEILTSLFANAFTLIPAARNSASTGSARDTLLRSDVARNLTAIGNSQEREDERTWWNLRTAMNSYLGKELEPNPSQFLVRNQSLRVPANLIGGGEQAALQLVWDVMRSQPITMIEEPESHLHPSLARDLFDALKKDAGHSQIIVSTHSPMFIDKSPDRSVWLLQLEDLETVARRVESPEDFRITLAELGLVPSDVFLKDLIVFVEGSTEEEAVFPIWAASLGLTLRDSPRVGLLSVGGDGQAEKYLRVWLRLMQHAPADFLVVLDAHAGRIGKKLENDLGIPSGKIKILSKHGIEDFYPRKLLLEAVKILFDEEIEERALPKSNVASFLNEKLGGKRLHGWKVQLGSYVAARMDKKDIPAEIRDLIEEIKTLLS